MRVKIVGEPDDIEAARAIALDAAARFRGEQYSEAAPHTAVVWLDLGTPVEVEVRSSQRVRLFEVLDGPVGARSRPYDVEVWA